MLPDRLFSTFKTASQGLAVQREKISVASRNIANANTSAPEGSRNIYRPQSVHASAVPGNKFHDVMAESITSLRRTHPDHLEKTTSGSKHVASPTGMGPQFEIAEADRFRYEYDPNHPDADENGMVQYPDVDLIREMTQMVSANRLYEANLSVVQAEKEIIKRSFDI